VGRTQFGAGPDGMCQLTILLNKRVAGRRMILMKFGERKATPIIFTGEGATLLKQSIEEGDEAVLFHDGKLVTAKVPVEKEIRCSA